MALSGLNNDFFCLNETTILGASRALSSFLAKKLIRSSWLNYTSSTDSQKESFTFDISTVDQLIIFIYFLYPWLRFVNELDNGGGVNENGGKGGGGGNYKSDGGGGGGGGGRLWASFEVLLPLKLFPPEWLAKGGGGGGGGSGRLWEIEGDVILWEFRNEDIDGGGGGKGKLLPILFFNLSMEFLSGVFAEDRSSWAFFVEFFYL